MKVFYYKKDKKVNTNDNKKEQPQTKSHNVIATQLKYFTKMKLALQN